MISEKSIIRLDKSHIASAGEILGRSLKDDPASIHVIPDKEDRHAKIHHVFQMTSCLGVRFGEVHATSPNLEAIAVWLPFKVYKVKFFNALICSLKAKMYKLGMEASKRVKPIQEADKEAHLEFAPTDHWYLQTLGVDPQYQGKGYGTILVKYMLDKIDKNPLPVFLETSNQRNVRFYEKLGFKVMKEYLVPETEVTQWYMLREKNE